MEGQIFKYSCCVLMCCIVLSFCLFFFFFLHVYYSNYQSLLFLYPMYYFSCFVCFGEVHIRLFMSFIQFLQLCTILQEVVSPLTLLCWWRSEVWVSVFVTGDKMAELSRVLMTLL